MLSININVRINEEIRNGKTVAGVTVFLCESCLKQIKSMVKSKYGYRNGKAQNRAA